MLLLADSRLKTIEPHLNFIIKRDKLPFTITVEAKSGANLADLERIGLKLLDENQYHLVLVCGGINDLTKLNRSSWIVSPRFDDIGHLVDTMTDKLNKLVSALESCTQYLIIGQLPGIHFNTFNKGKTDYDELQNVMNEGIRHINRVICSINEEGGLIPPWWLSDIHTFDKQTQCHLNKYVKFKDGLHPNEILTMQWAEKIVKSMSKNIQNWYS